MKTNPAFVPVDISTAELELDGSIHEGFAAAIMVKGKPRMIALFREYADAVQIMAIIKDAQGRIADGDTPERDALGWRSMASAPRDGTLVQLAFGTDVVTAGAYHRNDDDLYPWKFIDSQGEGLPIFNGARDDQYGPTHWCPMHPVPSATLKAAPAENKV
jgi:hypothetical protein